MDRMPVDERPTEREDEVVLVSGDAPAGSYERAAGIGARALVAATLLSATAMVGMLGLLDHIRCMSDDCNGDWMDWLHDEALLGWLVVATGLVVFAAAMVPAFVLRQAQERRRPSVQTCWLLIGFLVALIAQLVSRSCPEWDGGLTAGHLLLTVLAAGVTSAGVALFARTVLRDERSVRRATWFTMLGLGVALLAWPPFGNVLWQCVA